MTPSRPTVLVALLLAAAAAPAAAQAPFQYREYTLDSTVIAMAAIDEARTTAPKTLHAGPAVIQEIVWRAPYTGPSGDDPVYDVALTFLNDQLYQVIVTYERDRMAGLTDHDVIAMLSQTYGRALLRDARTAATAIDADVRPDMGVVAQWEDATARLLLLRSRSTGWRQYQLALVSRRLNAQARGAIVDARRMDALAAPQVERERRAQDAAGRAAADSKARDANKATFRP